MSYYKRWDPQENYYYAVDNCGFKPAEQRTVGSYSKYSSLDDKIDMFHYYTTCIKFGIGRATYDASQEIRSGDLMRDEGVALVKKYDGEFPSRWSKEIFDYLKNRPILKGLHILHGDVLLQEINELPISEPVRVIGNIPYNITSPIIFWLIEQLDYWIDAHIMMQKEVADRLTASVNTKAYGRLTVVVGAYLDIDQCFTIKPDVFIPKPKVDSAIVRLTKKASPSINDDKYLKFNKIVSAAFSQRRKMLRNTLKGCDIPKHIQEDIDFRRRPETLSIDEFASMV